MKIILAHHFRLLFLVLLAVDFGKDSAMWQDIDGGKCLLYSGQDLTRHRTKS